MFLWDLGKVKFGSKKAIFVVILVFFKPAGESATPPTHIWEVFPPKKRYPQWNPSMYHYNLNNVNFTAVPIIHFIDSHLIHNNGSSPHLHHATIFYPLSSSRLHQSTLQKCTINSRLPQPNFLNDFGFLDLSSLFGQWTYCWVRKIR